MFKDHIGRLFDEHYRYLDVDGNTIVGACVYESTLAMQHNEAFTVFEKLLDQIKPDRIIEIGTSHGGLILFIRHYLDKIGLKNTKIRTFDINRFPSHSRLLEENHLEIVYDNMFSEDYRRLEKPELILDFLSDSGTNIVICDGGSKINEFNLLSDYINNGDIIMAHDYAENLQYFQEHIMNKRWAWMEIEESNIKEACLKNHLTDFMKEDFNRVVWVCKQKLVS